jgi:hypothetical protein
VYLSFKKMNCSLSFVKYSFTPKTSKHLHRDL